MYSDGYDDSVFKFKKKYMDMVDKMNNITDVITIIKKINGELENNIKLISEIIFKLSDDLQLGRIQVNTINAKIDDALNFVSNKIYRKNRKNRINAKWINRDKLELLKRMYSSTNDIISGIKNELLMIFKDMFEFHEKDMNKVYLIYSEVKEIMIQLKQDLKKIFSVEDLLC